MNPTVSICCCTYNHADTIAEALESFLCQRADLPIEILVHDDASSDATVAILKRYAQRYPDIVKPVFETENQYKKGTAMDATFNFPRACGEYIALCEGDDFWCDPHKLRKQIECLEQHPGATFCFTNGYVRDMQTDAPDREFVPYYAEESAYFSPKTGEYDLGEISRLTFLPTASFLFPRSVFDDVPRALWLTPCPSGDLRLKLLCTAAGKAVYLHAFTCVYRLNSHSSTMASWGTESAERTRLRCSQVIAMLNEVDNYSEGRFHNDLLRLCDHQRRVMLETAPTHKLLRLPENKRVYKALPLGRRLKCRLKATVPASVFQAIKALYKKR